MKYIDFSRTQIAAELFRGILRGILTTSLGEEIEVDVIFTDASRHQSKLIYVIRQS